MRISLALLFAVVLQLSAEDGYAQRTRVAISMNNVSVEQVLNLSLIHISEPTRP